MIPFYSKRNQVFPAIWYGKAAVEKHFRDMEDWRKETALYESLVGKLPLPCVYEKSPGLLVMEYCGHPTLLDELERQEREGYSPEPWRALAAWLHRCRDLCQMLPEEGNLRNFLWNAERGSIIGLDLEGYHSQPLPDCGAKLIATLLEYAPKDTQVKQTAPLLLSRELSVSLDAVNTMRKSLCASRDRRVSAGKFSGIILAGGKSKRMGQNKAKLVLDGKTLLERQIEKLRALGIDDILLSGSECPELPGTRVIPDRIAERGPLGGIHACMNAAKNQRCLVLSVDVPLIPRSTLAQLCKSYTNGVMVLRHGDKIEPLIGIYDCSLETVIFSLIEKGSAPVRALAEHIEWSFFDYLGPEVFIQNCNSPEDFQSVCVWMKAFRNVFPK